MVNQNIVLKVLAAVDGKKTYIVAGVTALYALLVVGWGQGNWNTALPLILGGSGGLASLRSALSKIQTALQDTTAVVQAINSQSSTAPANAGSSTAAPSNQ